MDIKLKSARRYVTSDNQEHETRESALLHEKYLKRVERLKALNLYCIDSDERGQACVYSENLPQFIAENAEAILEALTVKQNRGPKGPRKPKAQ